MYSPQPFYPAAPTFRAVGPAPVAPYAAGYPGYVHPATFPVGQVYPEPAYAVNTAAYAPPPIAYQTVQPVQTVQTTGQQQARAEISPLLQSHDFKDFLKYYKWEKKQRARLMAIPDSQLPYQYGKFTLYNQTTNRPAQEAPLLFDKKKVIQKERKLGRTRYWPSTEEERDEILGQKEKKTKKVKSKRRKSADEEEEEVAAVAAPQPGAVPVGPVPPPVGYARPGYAPVGYTVPAYGPVGYAAPGFVPGAVPVYA